MLETNGKTERLSKETDNIENKMEMRNTITEIKNLMEAEQRAQRKDSVTWKTGQQKSSSLNDREETDGRE